jgi:hypothetical protein
MSKCRKHSEKKNVCLVRGFSPSNPGIRRIRTYVQVRKRSRPGRAGLLIVAKSALHDRFSHDRTPIIHTLLLDAPQKLFFFDLATVFTIHERKILYKA